MTTKVSIGLGGTGANSAASMLSSVGAVAKSGDTMTGQLNISSGGLLVTGTANVSANVAVGAGSQTAPSLTRSGDTDTGIYFPASNEMAITAGGTVAQAFNSNGVFFRNRIINGDMRIDQRNAGANVTVDGVSIYTLDRWRGIDVTDGSYTVQQSTTVPTGFVNSIVATVTGTDTSLAATQYAQIHQRIEGLNTSDLLWGSANAITVTLSFWVRSSLTGTFCATLTNNGGTRSYVSEYTINAANTWEKKIITISGDTSGTWQTGTSTGIDVVFCLAVGSSYQQAAGSWGTTAFAIGTSSQTNFLNTNGATFYITGVQLETGSVATPFERRPYGTELMLCQRYCQKLAGDTAYTVVTDGWQASTTVGYFTYCFSNPMRAAPTLTTGTVGDFYARNGSITSNLSTLTLDSGLNATKESVSFAATWAAAGGASGYGTQLVSGANAPKVILSAEL